MYFQTNITFSADEVLVYLRKSRSDDPLLTTEEVLAKHEAILDDWCKRNLNSKVPEENKYREIESGETIEARPMFKELLKHMESPKIKAILVVEVQRLSRGDLEDAGRLIKLLRYTNTVVITPQITYDLQVEYARDMFERELKRGNEFLEYQKKIMNRGRLLSVQQGHYIGSIPPYGYDKTVIVEDKKKHYTLKINEAEASVVRKIFDLYVNKGTGPTLISHHLNELGLKTRKNELWTQQAVKSVLENIHLTGKVRWNFRKSKSVVENGEIYKYRPKNKDGNYLICEGMHEAIISDELFQAAQEKCGSTPRVIKKAKVRNPLAGLLFCQCGKAMSLRTYKKNGVERSAPRLLCDYQSYCHTSSALFDEVIEKVSLTLKECIYNFELQLKNENNESQDFYINLINKLQSTLLELEKKEISQWEKYSEEGMPKEIFDKLNQKVIREKQETIQALEKAKESMPTPSYYQEKISTFQEALDALKDPDISAAKKNALLKTCIERIDYNREKTVRLSKATSSLPLRCGSNWSEAPIELDIKLRV